MLKFLTYRGIDHDGRLNKWIFPRVVWGDLFYHEASLSHNYLPIYSPFTYIHLLPVNVRVVGPVGTTTPQPHASSSIHVATLPLSQLHAQDIRPTPWRLWHCVYEDICQMVLEILFVSHPAKFYRCEFSLFPVDSAEHHSYLYLMASNTESKYDQARNRKITQVRRWEYPLVNYISPLPTYFNEAEIQFDDLFIQSRHRIVSSSRRSNFFEIQSIENLWYGRVLRKGSRICMSGNTQGYITVNTEI